MARYQAWNAEHASEIIQSHKGQDGSLLPILHGLQDAFGYVPEPVEPMIAEALNISRAEVHGVVTFYHDFRHEPPGRHVLKLCRAEACQAAGGDVLAAHAEAKLGMKLGSTSANNNVTIEPIYCLGLCSVAPSAMLGGKIHGRLNEKRLDVLIAEAQR
jgi:formate dehydrogenase subunit gamma